jgi:hypothetical protein
MFSVLPGGRVDVGARFERNLMRHMGSEMYDDVRCFGVCDTVMFLPPK